MYRQTFKTLLPILILASLILSACAKPTAVTQPTAVVQPTEKPTAKPTEVPQVVAAAPTNTPEPCAPATEGALAGVDPRGQTVVWWHNHSGARQEGLKKLVAEFNLKNDCGITVDPQYQGSYNDIRDKMNAGLGSGEVPSLVVGYQNDQAFYQKVGGLADFNVYVNDPYWGLTKVQQEDFFASFWHQSVHPAYDNQRLGFAPNRSMEVIYWNKSWASELGFANPPATPAEFEEQACAAAAANGDGTGGFILRDDASGTAAWTYAFGGDILTPDGTGYGYNSQATIDAMTMLKRMYDNKCAYFFTEGFPNPEFAARRALMTMGSSSGLPFYISDVKKAGKGDAFEMIAIPHTTPNPVQNVYGGDVMVPVTNPEQQLAAWIFVKWFTGPETMAEWVIISNYFPTRSWALRYLLDYRRENPLWASASDMLQYSYYEPQLISYQAVRDATEETFNAIMQGDCTNIKALLDQLTEKANQLQAEQLK